MKLIEEKNIYWLSKVLTKHDGTPFWKQCGLTLSLNSISKILSSAFQTLMIIHHEWIAICKLSRCYVQPKQISQRLAFLNLNIKQENLFIWHGSGVTIYINNSKIVTDVRRRVLRSDRWKLFWRQLSSLWNNYIYKHVKIVTSQYSVGICTGSSENSIY